MGDGEFQKLCDTYISAIGYHAIVPLGSHSGTRKTTTGTPDAYFVTEDEKYVFAEYTTQRDGVFEKISKDISKCLDYEKTHIGHNNISEIIYCYTTSNISPEQDNQLKCMCKE